MRLDLEDLMPWLLGAAVLALVVFCGVLAVEESDKWERFKAAHACRVVGRMDGEIFNTFGVAANGQMTVGIGSTSEKTGWLCDDGVTYWK